MRRGGFVIWSMAGLSSLLTFMMLSSFAPAPALAGFQVMSGELASCSGGGVDVDLVAKGTVEDVKLSRVTSQAEVRVEEVLLGDRNYAGETLLIETNSGTNGGDAGAVSFSEGARYELYLQREGDEWRSNACMGTTEIAAEGTLEASPALPETGGPSVSLLVAVSGLCLLGAVVVVRQRAR